MSPAASKPTTGVLTFVAIAIVLLIVMVLAWTVGSVFG